MERPSIWRTQRTRPLAPRSTPAPATDEFLAAMSAEEGDACCCGRPADDPGRCACNGQPDSGVDCCCQPD